MNINDLETDQTIIGPSGNQWRITAVNKTGESPHVLADLVMPVYLDGASSVRASFSAKALLRFERVAKAA